LVKKLGVLLDPARRVWRWKLPNTAITLAVMQQASKTPRAKLQLLDSKLNARLLWLSLPWRRNPGTCSGASHWHVPRLPEAHEAVRWSMGGKTGEKW
jgi:hypothetical protein